MVNRVSLLFLVALVCLAPFRARAYGSYDERWFYVGGGVLSNGFNVAADSATGELGWFGRQYLQLGALARLEFWNVWGIAPALGFTPLSRAIEDSAGSSSILTATLPFVRSVSFFDLKLGPGLGYQFLRGEGGTVQLRDGNGSDSFALPGRDRSIRTLFVDLGVGIGREAFRFDFDTIVSGALSSRRTYSFVTQVSYGLF